MNQEQRGGCGRPLLEAYEEGAVLTIRFKTVGKCPLNVSAVSARLSVLLSFGERIRFGIFSVGLEEPLFFHNMDALPIFSSEVGLTAITGVRTDFVSNCVPQLAVCVQIML